MRLWRQLGHKQAHKHITKYYVRAATAAWVTITSLLPQPALSFEANLPNSASQKLVAVITEYQDDAPDRRTGASLVANTPIIIETGRWVKPKKIAYVSSARSLISAAESGSKVILEGEASYYSRSGCLGCGPGLIMANGQPLNDTALTIAIGVNRKHLVGRSAKVTNLDTGKSVMVLITDTGGFYQARYGHRVADLTVATKQAIGMRGGTGRVRVEVD